MIDLWLKSLTLVALLAASLLGGAGRVAWQAGWILLGLYGAFVLSALLVVDPELLKERARPGTEFERRDAVLATVGFLLLYPIAMAVAGLDAVRLGGDAGFDWPLRLLGGVAFAAGYGLALWAMVANRYFSTFVRIQSERGHEVVQQGPYAAIRHPGYAGMLAAHLGMPLLLGSWWAYVPVLLGSGVFIVRILQEERVLAAQLPGYDRYVQTHRWRLAPGVW